jgi:signal-transduction protein with cAMP-binding, CBS, and nucleotidyltransferase domain
MSIESSQFLGSLTEDQIEALIPEMTIRTYNQGETVVAAGEKLGAYLYLVLNGALKSNG